MLKSAFVVEYVICSGKRQNVSPNRCLLCVYLTVTVNVVNACVKIQVPNNETKNLIIKKIRVVCISFDSLDFVHQLDFTLTRTVAQRD